MDTFSFGYFLVWGLLTLVGVLIMFLVFAYLQERYGQKVTFILNVSCIPIVVLWGWLVARQMSSFAHTHVYVGQNEVVMTLRGDSITLYEDPGLYVVPEFDQSIIWRRSRLSTLQITERPNIFDSGNIIAIATLDFTDVNPVKAYEDFECASNSCLALIMISDIRMSHTFGCESVIDNLEKFEVYGVITEISYCR